MGYGSRTVSDLTEISFFMSACTLVVKHACLRIRTWKHWDRDWKWDSFSWRQAGDFLPFFIFFIFFMDVELGGWEGVEM